MTPRAERRGAVLGVAALAVLLGACGGGDPPSTTSSGSTTAAPSASASAGSTTRPEGPWTLVAWTVQRSDVTVAQRLARVILGSFEPSCESGPCDLTISPAGSNGTYREPEAPPGEGATPLNVPFTLAWKGTAYEGGVPARVGSCTNAKGEVVANGYSTTTTMSLTFVAPAAGVAARVHGTVTHVSKGTKAGLPKGCTDFTETEALGGAPTGSLDPKTAPTGEYDASLSTTASTPKSLSAVGSGLWLGTMKAAGDAARPTITGLTASTGPLTLAADGWAAAPPPAPTQCRGGDGSLTDKGADGAETFGSLRPVAITRDGAPIFVGSWRLRANPNAAGLAKDCSLAVYEGRLYLVPHGAAG